LLNFQQAWQKIKQKKAISVPLIILALGFLIFLVLIITKPQTDKSAVNDNVTAVTIMSLKPDTYIPYINLYGRIESPQTSDIESEVEADVLEVNIREGDSVEQDALLVKLDDSDLKLILQQREAEVSELEAEVAIENKKHEMDIKALDHEKYLLTLAKKQVERQKKLIQTNAISELALDEANEEMRRRDLSVTVRTEVVTQHENRIKRLEAQLKRAKALQELARRNVEDTNIVAPFSGKITQLNVSPGERVQVGEVMLQMFNRNDVEIRAQIPENYIQRARMALNSNFQKTISVVIDGKQYRVYLDRISGEVGQGSAGVDGLFKLIDHDGNLSVGRIIEMKFTLPAEKNVFAVPETAIFNSNTVYKVVDNYLQAVKIERIGNAVLSPNEKAVLIKGDQLKAGDKIIINPLPNAISGLKVNIIKEIMPGSENVIETE